MSALDPLLPGPERDEELPRYTVARPRPVREGPQRPFPTEFSCSLLGNDGQAWMTLFIQSRAPSRQTPPIFFEGDQITGRVELFRLKGTTVKGISISIKGTTMRVGREEQPFLDLTQDLFPPVGEKATRLDGKHSWSFALELPRTVDLTVNFKDDAFVIGKSKDNSLQSSQTFRLPPSLSEKGHAIYIDYRIVVTVKRGMFITDSVLATVFSYLPMTRPALPSILRQAAYSLGSDLIGPGEDSEGWRVLPAITQSGVLFGKNEVDLDIQLSLAMPVVYTTGSPIPLYLKLTSSSPVLLDLICSGAVPMVHLACIFATTAKASLDDASDRSNNIFKEPVADAQFWATQEGNIAHSRTFQGEIITTKKLKPSFHFPGPSLRYAVEMLPFEPPGFSPLPKQSFPKVLITQPVKLVIGSNGIQPRSYARPPEYEVMSPSAADYARSSGYLENGNQRFLHRHHGGFF